MTTTLTRPFTYAHEMAIRYFCERGFHNYQIRQVLPDLPKGDVEAVAAGYRSDGTVTLYRDDCIACAKADPHRYEGLQYLYVRGVPLRVMGEALGMSPNYLRTDPEAKRRYQARQVEIVRAAVAEGREL